MRPGFALPGLADGGVTDGTRRKQPGFLAQALGLVGQTFFQGVGLFETAAVLRHRVLLNFQAEAEKVDSDQVIQKLIEAVPEPKSGL